MNEILGFFVLPYQETEINNVLILYSYVGSRGVDLRTQILALEIGLSYK